jgi:hypothetical protein
MKKRQTMGKMMRDRELRERRELKQQRKDERRAGAGAEADGAEPTADGEPTAPTPEGDTQTAERAVPPGE